MFGMLYPDEYADSVFSIDFQKLYDKGFRGLIFDIDNTLVHHGDDSTPEVDALFAQLHEIGFQTLLLSNNDTERITRFLKNIDSLYIADANKPAPEGYKKALEMMGLKAGQAVVIGDQIFTDIYGAKRCGIPTILVHFIQLPTETSIGKRRYLEFLILRIRSMRKSNLHKLGSILKRED